MANQRSHQQRDNANAFDDLLGQLVDELALTPTMEPEPPPPLEPPPPVAVAPVRFEPVYEPAPPPRSNVMGLAIGGGIAVAGIAIALVLALGGGKPPEPVAQRDPVEVKAPTPVPVPVPVAQPLPPVTPPAGNLAVGTGPTGLPVDPNAPPVVATATTPAGDDKAAAKPKPKPKPKPAGPKKPPPGKPAVVDPF